jgi:hypothetical protein
MRADSDYLAAPDIDWTPEKLAAFDRLYARLCQQGPEKHFDYQAPYPKYEFFCYLVEHRQALLHGSNKPDIAIFEPRPQTDYVGRSIKAVFATPDGIWPIYFAIIDRANYRGSLRNACSWKVDENGQRRKVYYFSINAEMLAKDPWIQGTIYVLPRTTFEQVRDFEGGQLEEWISLLPVTPLGKILVAPQEFPYLDQVEGHTDRLNSLIGILLTSFTQKEELDDGYGFQYDWEAERMEQMIALLGELREVAPTVRGEIIMEPVGGPVWLRIRGGLEIKGAVAGALQQLAGDVES